MEPLAWFIPKGKHFSSTLELQPQPSGEDSNKRNEKPKPASPKQWTKGVRLCAWVVATVLCINIILTIAAVVLAYSRNGGTSFQAGPIYQGNCSRAKGWSTGLHFLINVLSTALLAASNYSMQFLASPCRAEVDEAHQRKGWMRIGVPNIGGLLLFGKGRRQWLGFLLLVTSLPIHLIYNSAVYFALGPSEYGVFMAQANSTAETFQDEATCSPRLYELAASAYTSPQELSKQECLDTFARDYVYGRRAVFLLTSEALPAGHGLLSRGTGHDTGYSAKGRAPFDWMCGTIGIDDSDF